jgi:predicted transposase YbfD/YdcC
MRIELAEALSQFRQERVMQTAQDAKARAEAQRERQSTAAQDARDRSAAGYERHGLGIQRHAADADDIRQRASDITGTLSEFHRERFMHAAQDARARAEAEHERQAIAAQDARARAAVAAELREIWSLHSAGLGSSR